MLNLLKRKQKEKTYVELNETTGEYRIEFPYNLNFVQKIIIKRISQSEDKVFLPFIPFKEMLLNEIDKAIKDVAKQNGYNAIIKDNKIRITINPAVPTIPFTHDAKSVTIIFSFESG